MEHTDIWEQRKCNDTKKAERFFQGAGHKSISSLI